MECLRFTSRPPTCLAYYGTELFLLILLHDAKYRVLWSNWVRYDWIYSIFPQDTDYHPWPYLFILHQFQLISVFIFCKDTDFRITTGNDVDRARVCFSIICYKNADGLYFKSIYCTKMRDLGESVCAIKIQKNNNPVSHLRFGIHPHTTSMIYINS